MTSEGDYILTKKGNCPRVSAKLRKYLLGYSTFEYFEIINHDLNFHLKDGKTCKIRGRMCEAILLIDMDLFIIPHESYVVCRLCIVNYLKDREGLDLIMKSGNHVPATRLMKKECKALIEKNKENLSS